MAESFHRGKYKAAQRNAVSRELDVRVDRLADATLRISLSDESDPCFMCTLTVTRNDYDEIKKSQGLLVDFDTFPAQFVRLLQQCESGNLFLSLYNDGPLHLYLEFIERNEFKRLVHLSLKFFPASDAELKKSMAENILTLKKYVTDMQSTIASKGTMYNEKEKMLESRVKDLTNMLTQSNEDRAEREKDHQELLRKERERFDQEKIELKKCMEACSQNQLSSLKDSINRKDRQLEDALTRSRQMQDTIRMLEMQNNEKNDRIVAVENELRSTKMEIETWKMKNEHFDRDLQDKEQIYAQTKMRLADSEKALHEKSDALKDVLETLRNIKKDKIVLEERLSVNERLSAKKHMELQELNEQIMKANKIIAKQNSDILELREKLMCRTAIALEQEKVINNNTEEISKMQHKEQDLLKEINENKQAHVKLQEELEVMKNMLLEKTETITNNTSVIQWLHKKIDAMQLINEVNSIHQTITPTYRDIETDDNSRSPDIYTSSHRSDGISLKSSMKSSSKSKSNSIEEPFSVDPAYLQPTAHSSVRTIGRSKSQESSTKRTYPTLPEVRPGINKENKNKIGTRKSMPEIQNIKVKNNYIKSGISTYFTNT